MTDPLTEVVAEAIRSYLDRVATDDSEPVPEAVIRDMADSIVQDIYDYEASEQFGLGLELITLH